MKGGYLLTFLLGIAAAIGVGGVMAGMGAQAAGPVMTPTEVVTAWLDAARVGDVSTMVELTAEETRPAIERDRIRIVRTVNVDTAPLLQPEQYVAAEDELGRRPGTRSALPPAGASGAASEPVDDGNTDADATTGAAQLTYTLLTPEARSGENGSQTVVVQISRRGQTFDREFTLVPRESDGEWRVLSWRDVSR